MFRASRHARRFGTYLLAAALAVAMLVDAQHASSSSTQLSRIDTSSALVQLTSDPLTLVSPGGRVAFGSPAVTSRQATLAAERDAFKSWLHDNAPSATVTSEYELSLNAVAVTLNGTALATLAGAPGVRLAEYQRVFQPADDGDRDLSIIHAQQAWLQGGSAGSGQGVKVAIIDSGIDISHPCFSESGYPAQSQLGDAAFTNNKVIAAKVFAKTAPPGATPEAIQSHGTHVAGTVACNLDTPANVDGVVVPYDVSGVAPAALLGNYNVFPGVLTTTRSEDIVNALDAAYGDDFDIANLSLGNPGQSFSKLVSRAIDDLDQADMVVAAAAGTCGPGHLSIASPGRAERALTAGASSVPHFVGAPFVWGANSTGIAAGDFAVATSDLTAPIGVVPGSVGGLGTACAALPGGSLTGSIAVLSRGACSFSTQIRNAQTAGAVAVVVVNDVAGDPIAMDADGTANQPTIPAYMASLADRASLAGSNGVSATVSATLAYIVTTNVDIMAGFSGQGPTKSDFRVKPDVVAPGVNVLNATAHTACASPPCWAFASGTSSAAAHLAGSAAVVRGQHPNWSAGDVRSAIVNTADQGVLKDFTNGAAVVQDVNIIGAGRENLLSAVGASLSLAPVSASFGAVAASATKTQRVTVTVRNLTSTTKTYSFALDPPTGSGATFGVGPSSVTLLPGESGSVKLTLVLASGASLGDHQTLLRITTSTEVAHAAVYAFVK
jgi:subtilisin family serine protease